MKKFYLILLMADSAHAAGGPGNALTFDGVDDYVSVPYTAALRAYPLTATAWIKTTQTNGNAVVLSMVNGGGMGGLRGWRVSLVNGSVVANYISGTANFVPGVNGGLVADGAWHHVAFVVDAASGRIYVDGALQQSRSWSGTAGAALSTSDVLLGRRSETGSADYFSGLLDEVTVWNFPLSHAQIQANKNRSLTGAEAGLLAYYRCDDSGTTLGDSAPASFNNDGTLLGGASFSPSGLLPFTPAAETLLASGIGGTTATLNGLANPEGTNTTAWFGWGTTTNYDNTTPPQSVGSGASTVSFSQGLAGLAVNTTYYFRALASNSLGIAMSTNQSFTTFGPPRVQTLPASATGVTIDTPNGVANPGGLNTTAWFEWGITTNYGNVTVAQPMGRGLTNVNFSQVLAGLGGRITYHFRAVASNSLGIAFGADATIDWIGFDSIRGLSNDSVRMTLLGQNSSAYLIDASTNLTHWKRIACLYATNNTAQFSDPESVRFSQRFYRYHNPRSFLQPLFHFDAGDLVHTWVLFRHPSFSGSTAGFVDTSFLAPNFTRLTTSFPDGVAATHVLHVSWVFTNDVSNPWLRLTTSGAQRFPSPTIDFTQGLCFDVYSDRNVYLHLGLRETTTVGEIGQPGGSTGSLEWVGATVDNSISPPRGRLITAGQWHRVCFFIPEEPVRNFFMGNGVLTPLLLGRGVLEHITVVPATGLGFHNLYFGDFHTLQTNE